MTIYQKNGKYYCRFQINGERHHYLCSGASSVKEAKAIENAFKYKVQQQQNGVIPKEEVNKVRLKQLRDNYLEYSRLNRAVYKQDIGRIKIIFEFFKENTEAKNIVRKDIEEFKSWLLNQGRSKKTVNLYLGICRKMYNLAIDNEWIEKNLFSKNVEFKLEPRKLKILADDSQEVLEKASTSDFLPIITVALNSALRRGNIIDLKWEDINLDTRVIEITKNKGNKHIKLPINDTLYKLFSEMDRTSEYVFTNPETGRKWNTTAFNKAWRKIREKAGLQDLRFHGLRHTVGTRLARKNVPIPVIKKIMAHSDIKTTMMYVHVDSIDVVNAINSLGQY